MKGTSSLSKGVFCAVVFVLSVSLVACHSEPVTNVSTIQDMSKSTPAASAPLDPNSCKAYLQEFYNWYAVRSDYDVKHRVQAPPSNDVLTMRPQALSPELAQLLKQVNDAQANSKEEIGLDSDPFSNSQDVSSSYVVESATIKNDHCMTVVSGYEKKLKEETVMPELAPVGTSWQIVNIHYGKGMNTDDMTMIDTLKILIAQFKSEPTKK
jgi:Protein of unknown function (DUF3828)